MKLIYKKGSIDVTVLIFIQDSASTTGAGKTGLLHNSAGLVCYYARPGVAAVALSLITQTVTGAHADGGFIAIDAVNMPGVYRLDLSDAILATGVNSVVLMLREASGMAPLTLEIQLVDIDLLSAVNLGLSNLNAAVTTRSSHTAADVWAVGTRALTDKVGFALSAAGIQAIWDVLLTALIVTGSIGKKLADWVVGTIDTYTGNTKQTGDAFARLGIPAGISVSADVAAIKADTAAILLDTGTDGVVLPQAQADKVWGTFARALTDKADFALSSASRDAVWDQASVLTLSFESLLTRAYQMVNNRMNVTNSTGVVALRNIGNTLNIATGSVMDDLTTTVRAELTW